MGVVSSNWCDCIVLSILCMLKPSCLTDEQTPLLGTPLVPCRVLATKRRGRDGDPDLSSAMSGRKSRGVRCLAPAARIDYLARYRTG